MARSNSVGTFPRDIEIEGGRRPGQGGQVDMRKNAWGAFEELCEIFAEVSKIFGRVSKLLRSVFRN